MRRSNLLLAALAAGLSACASEAPAPSTEDAAPSTAPATVTRDADEWAIGPAGAGTVRTGMTLAELRPLLAPSVDAEAAGQECAYLSVAGAPDSVLFMADQGALVRLDVIGGDAATAEGGRIGDTEASIRSRYAGFVRTRPHKYTDGSYLIVIPGAPADTLHRIVFETDGSRVTRYRAGLFPQVEWVEGCS